MPVATPAERFSSSELIICIYFITFGAGLQVINDKKSFTPEAIRHLNVEFHEINAGVVFGTNIRFVFEGRIL